METTPNLGLVIPSSDADPFDELVLRDAFRAVDATVSGRVIGDTLLAAPAATFDFSAIPATYRHLKLELYLRGDAASSDLNCFLRFNTDAGANYSWQELVGRGAVIEATDGIGVTSGRVARVPGATAPAGSFANVVVQIPQYAGVTGHKSYGAGPVLNRRAVTSTDHLLILEAGIWLSAAAVNRITVLLASGNFATGSRATLYALL